MQHAAAAEVSFGSRKHQTVLFYHKDKSWLDTNIEATAELLARLKQDVGHPQSVNGHEVFYDVPVSHILQYFEHYQFMKAVTLLMHDSSAATSVTRTATERYVRGM